MAVIVNGEKIEDTDIQNEAEILRPEYEKVFDDMEPDQREAQLLEWSKENLIEKTLLKQEIQNSRYQIDKDKLEKAFDDLKKQYKDKQDLYREFNTDNEEKIKELLEITIREEQIIKELRKDSPKPSSSEIQDYYTQNKQDFKAPERIHAAHIVKYINWQTDETAALEAINKAKEELDNGANFEMTVLKYSDRPHRGGDLGYITKGQMAGEFEDILFKLGPGQTSSVFRTRFGYHIAKVYQKQPPSIPNLENVRGHIIKKLEEKIHEKAFHDFLDMLKSKAKIEEV